jgi:GNAT superfamily N-acetyltransferase
MAVIITRVGAHLPLGFEVLREASVAEEFRFLNRLEEHWRDGRYDDDGLATVRIACCGDATLGVGAQTYDECDPAPDHRRMRHFYVSPSARRGGVGRQLAGALIEDAFACAGRLRLRATHEASMAFWDAMGFSRIEADRSTHEMRRPRA